MTDQPEALRLADRLEGRWALHPEMQQAAAELRRLHKAETDFHMDYRMKCDAELKKMQAERDAAVALHTELLMCVSNKYPGETRHETAKRYLLDREKFGIGAKAAIDATRGE